jgi:hypothetical protein
MTDPRRRFIITRSARAAKVDTYDQMHEIAGELGYPSILEALEAVATLTAERDAALMERDRAEYRLLTVEAEAASKAQEIYICEVVKNQSSEAQLTTARQTIEAIGSTLGGIRAGTMRLEEGLDEIARLAALTESKP